MIYTESAFGQVRFSTRCYAKHAAQGGGDIDFEGRKARVVHLSQGKDTPHTARIELDLGDGYLALLGYFSGDEFMEEACERPSGEAT